MGIHGARSLMDADPARYSETFTWECDDRGSPPNPNQTLGLLIDAKSVLYHVVLKQENVLYASPATVYECCGAYFTKLIQVVGRHGGVHVFFDGLAPEHKIPSQIKRMGEHASSGDKLARGDITGSVKLLHNLAEWAFVEAVQRLYLLFPDRLSMHRPSIGEAEAHINHWLVQHPSTYSTVAIISEDSDFLVYESCPGFIPPSTIHFSRQKGKQSFQGQHYLRDKFIRAFLGESTKDTTVMTAIAALAGCDYTLSDKEQNQVLGIIRKRVASSDLGGLRPKSRNNPSASSTLTAILRLVAHYKAKTGGNWLHHLCKDFADPVANDAQFAIQSIHEVYYYTIQTSPSPDFDISPGMVEVRRLLQYGMVYCYPIVETFRTKPDTESSHGSRGNIKDPALTQHHYSPGGVHAHALIPSPPLSTQLEMWISRSSIWHFPHFRQIRARLYSYIRLQVYHSRCPSNIPPGDFWTKSSEPTIEEVVRVNSGPKCTVERTLLTVPDHSIMSAMFDARMLLEADDQAIDRALVFCIHGTPQQLPSLRQRGVQKCGVIFVASTMLPFNLACLLLMMSTTPDEVASYPPPALSYNDDASSEAYQVLPILSVACAHANLLVDTISTFWPEKEPLSSLASPPIGVSSTFRHDNALMIWNALRECRNLEYLRSQDVFISEDAANISGYLKDCFTNLRNLRPGDVAWSNLLHQWHKTVAPLYDVWWETFNLDEIGDTIHHPPPTLVKAK